MITRSALSKKFEKPGRKLNIRYYKLDLKSMSNYDHPIRFLQLIFFFLNENFQLEVKSF